MSSSKMEKYNNLKTQADRWRALLDGESLQHPKWGEVFLENGGLMLRFDSESSASFCHLRDNDWTIKEPEPMGFMGAMEACLAGKKVRRRWWDDYLITLAGKIWWSDGNIFYLTRSSIGATDWEIVE